MLSENGSHFSLTRSFGSGSCSIEPVILRDLVAELGVVANEGGQEFMKAGVEYVLDRPALSIACVFSAVAWQA